MRKIIITFGVVNNNNEFVPSSRYIGYNERVMQALFTICKIISSTLYVDPLGVDEYFINVDIKNEDIAKYLMSKGHNFIKVS